VVAVANVKEGTARSLSDMHDQGAIVVGAPFHSLDRTGNDWQYRAGAIYLFEVVRSGDVSTFISRDAGLYGGRVAGAQLGTSVSIGGFSYVASREPHPDTAGEYESAAGARYSAENGVQGAGSVGWFPYY
jgi:hypothetical protein